MSDHSQRTKMLLAACAERMLAAHAHLGEGVAMRLAPRIPPMRAIELYCDAEDLDELDTAYIRMRALARLAVNDPPADPAHSDDGVVRHAWTIVRDGVRTRLAPHGDPQLQEAFAYEMAHARTILLKLHVRNALRLAAGLRRELSGPEAVSLYIERMSVHPDLRGAVHAVTLARLGAERHRALLRPAATARAIARATAAPVDVSVPA